MPPKNPVIPCVARVLCWYSRSSDRSPPARGVTHKGYNVTMGLYEHYQRYKLDPTPDRQTTFSVGDSYVFRGLSGSPLRSPGAIVKVIEIIDTDETGDLQLKLTWLNPDGAPFGRESFYAEVSFVRARELVAQGIWHHIGSADEEVTV